MRIQCLLFKKRYFSVTRNYTLLSNVKYRIKREDSRFYYTVKDIRLPKNLENIVYEVLYL